MNWVINGYGSLVEWGTSRVCVWQVSICEGVGDVFGHGGLYVMYVADVNLQVCVNPLRAAE